jgi:hypothetical protein
MIAPNPIIVFLPVPEAGNGSFRTGRPAKPLKRRHLTRPVQPIPSFDRRALRERSSVCWSKTNSNAKDCEPRRTWTGTTLNKHGANKMPQEVCSPITRKGSKVGSGQPLSPGARSMPRGDSSRRDQGAEPQPSGRGEEPARAEQSRYTRGIVHHAEEPEREHEEQRRDVARFRRGDQEEPADPEKSRMAVHITHEPEPARDDSVGVFDRIKRLLPRKQQPQPKPYRFKAFPTSSDW